MAQRYLPQTLRFLSPFFDDEDEGMFPKMPFSKESGLSISEDDTHVHIEAAVPGLSVDDVEVTFENGVLWIKGEKKEEETDKKKKYYKKAMTSFAYHIAVPGQIDTSREPEAVLEDGMMKINFLKVAKETPKKLKIQKK